MECNKDEATRAKKLAEKKFIAKDLKGARKFALKAQNLHPELEGIHQMIATVDVHISAENKINGEADWYGILGVSPKADDETVRKHYRKLALMLHPDKNKSLGADGAFKLISEAWSLLSDKAKRVAYDQKRNGKIFQKVSTPNGDMSAPTGANGFYNATKTAGSSAKTFKSASTSSTHKSKPKTFWTVCHLCKMHYEYLRVYLNHNLLCPNCHDPFLAVETPPPASRIKKTSSAWNFSQEQQSSDNQAGRKNTTNSGRTNAASGLDSHNQTNFQWSPFSRAGGASAAAQAATVVQQAYEKVRREREAQAATKREEAMRRKHHVSKRMHSNSSAGHSNPPKKRKVMEDGRNGGAGTANASGSKQGSLETGRNGTIKPSIGRDASQIEIQNQLIEKAKKEICKKLHEWKSLPTAETAARDRTDGIGNADAKGKESFVEENGANEQNKSEDLVHRTNPVSSSSCVNPNAETVEAMSISVPDPDFHDFDKDRTERAFVDNQVWAAYDNDDGMPRYYAMIHNVISLNPFKMQISWLNSKTNCELGPLSWVASGFLNTCGDFRVGRHEINGSLNSFSHKVKWTKSSHGVVCIYPRKGDVWAVYRNWSPDWNELTADEVIHKYDMVEILEDYHEEYGVTVIPLVKAAGFKTVFHYHLDPREVRRIPREEMFRFSHQVPSHLLTGHEAPKAPKGCWELDPAATPPELLQVIIDVKEEEILENDENAREEHIIDIVEKATEKDTMENGETIKEEERRSSVIPEEVETVEHVEETTEDKTMEDANEKPDG
ncbi:hypothetical protein SLA2020_130910 [Shorea laevis]